MLGVSAKTGWIRCQLGAAWAPDLPCESLVSPGGPVGVPRRLCQMGMAEAMSTGHKSVDDTH